VEDGVHGDHGSGPAPMLTSPHFHTPPGRATQLQHEHSQTTATTSAVGLSCLAARRAAPPHRRPTILLKVSTKRLTSRPSAQGEY